MGSDDIQRMAKALASAAAQARAQFEPFAEAARAASDASQFQHEALRHIREIDDARKSMLEAIIKPTQQAMRIHNQMLADAQAQQAMLADTIRRFRHDHAAAIRSFAPQMDIGKTLASQFAEAARAASDASQYQHEALRRVREIDDARKSMLEATIKPTQQAMRIHNQMLAEAQVLQAKLADATRPFREAASLRQNLLREILTPLEEKVTAIAATLEHYEPDVRVDGDTLILDGTAYTPEDISHIENDFLYAQDGVFGHSHAQVVWDKIPPAARWLIKEILSALIGIVLYCIIFGTPDGALPQRQHERKAEVRQLLREASRLPGSQLIAPFINTERLLVHVTPNQRSPTIHVLYYPQEVIIIEYRQKKRWIRIEWQDSVGTTHTGWVLGRYVFRPPADLTTYGAR